ncbi:MAG: hypothetical protein H7Y38_16445 [Armatimonadetes bacterium]|nr:hypothetical protein [Armatimonadota bacterium]
MDSLQARADVGTTGARDAPPVPANRLRAGYALGVGLPLTVANVWWVILAEKVGRGPYFTTISLFANAFFTLIVLLLLNALVRRAAPRAAMSQAELLTVYTMVTLGSALAGHDSIPGLIQMLGHPYRFDNGANGFLGRFGAYLPTPLMVSDKDALTGYYAGNANLYRPENYGVWLKPVALWTVFIGLLLWVMQCLNVLVRRGWQERERLPFPVMEMPLQMTDPDARLWKSRLFWIGFGLCVAVELVNGLHYFYPSIPSLNVQHTNVEGQGIFATRPWNAVGFTCYSFYPFVIGLGYLLPLDLLFSCWAFYLYWKAQLIVSRQFALDVTPDFPFVREQSFGGYLAILVFLLWNGRPYFAEVWKQILGEPSEVDDKNEAFSYRTAAIGALIGFAGLVGCTVWAGMSPGIAATAFAIYFALSLAVTRLRAELGPPVHDLHFSGPDHIMTRVAGTPAFKAQDLTMLSFFYWFNRAYRSHPQPGMIEGQKAIADLRSSQRTLFWCLVAAGIVGTLATFWAFLHCAYAYGTQAKFGNGSIFASEAYNRLNSWLQSPQPPNVFGQLAIVGGFAFSVLLMVLRIRVPWWPLHPIGFAISSSWSMNLVWMPLLFAWIIKLFILRYGGVRLYRDALPFFLGLILGQMVAGSLWHLLGLYLDVTPYSFWGG